MLRPSPVKVKRLTQPEERWQGRGTQASTISSRATVRRALNPESARSAPAPIDVDPRTAPFWRVCKSGATFLEPIGGGVVRRANGTGERSARGEECSLINAVIAALRLAKALRTTAIAAAHLPEDAARLSARLEFGGVVVDEDRSGSVGPDAVQCSATAADRGAQAEVRMPCLLRDATRRFRATVRMWLRRAA